MQQARVLPYDKKHKQWSDQVALRGFIDPIEMCVQNLRSLRKQSSLGGTQEYAEIARGSGIWVSGERPDENFTDVLDGTVFVNIL